ncbi:hypothetical protein SSX86_002235 [Deinandra increscens subsp. villosa]|uniref:HMG box domain-containing protein n=1 Tax=Deinandra increscens subsp. villosa TaxID=3103831 RepID=A0AAP0H7U3_9ASTR
MRGPKSTATIADTTKKTKTDAASSKNSGAPRRPPTAFFIFMEQFRKDNKENFPDNKSVSVAKECGATWKYMSDSEKAPYVAKAAKKKAEYEIAMKLYLNDEINESASTLKSSSSLNTHGDVEREAASS